MLFDNKLGLFKLLHVFGIVHLSLLATTLS